jgi:hypothetical protein
MPSKARSPELPAPPVLGRPSSAVFHLADNESGNVEAQRAASPFALGRLDLELVKGSVDGTGRRRVLQQNGVNEYAAAHTDVRDDAMKPIDP